MLKKIMIICCCLESFCVCSADNAPCSIKNVESEQTVSEAMKDLITKIQVYIDNNQIKNAQQMYDFVTSIRSAERNIHMLDFYDVIRSFLREQDNALEIRKLMSRVIKLVDALTWLNIACYKKDEGSFYNKSANMFYILQTDIFIHLNKEQAQWCLDVATKMSTAMNISAIVDDAGAEDGVALTPVFFEKELANARTINNSISKIEEQIKNFADKVDEIKRNEIVQRIEKLSSTINNLKNIEVDVDGKKIRISKNMVHQLRKVSGSVMSRLHNALNNTVSAKV